MRKYLSGVAICFLLISVLMGGLATPAASESKEPVKIAGIWITTGPVKSHGERLGKGIKLAVKQINEIGGILGGRKVKLLVYDEGTSAEVAVASTRKAISDGCKGISSGSAAMTSLMVQSVAKEFGIPIGLGIACSKKFVSPEHSFYGSIHASLFVRTVDAPYYRWIAKQGYKTISFINFDSERTRDAQKVYHDMLDKTDSPLKIIREVWTPVGQPSVELETIKIVADNPDFIHAQIWTSASQVSFFKTLKNRRYKGGFGIVDATLQASAIKAVPEAAEGCVCPFPYLPNPSPESQAYEKAFIEEYGHPSSTIAYLSYEATMILLKGMDKAGTDSDLKKIADAMHSLKWMTPRGAMLKIFPNGQVDIPFNNIGQVQNGKIVIVDKVPILEEDWTK